MYPRYWETYHSVNAYDKAFLDDGTINPERKLKTQTNNLESIADPEIDELIIRYRESSDKAEMIELAHRLDEKMAEHASFVPGFVQPFYRVGSWRWIRYPDGFNLKHSANAGRFFIHWIDLDMKKETLEARKSGRTFPPQINVYDQFKDS
jgi:microcin C transport system substrate-binding protein